MESTPGRSSQIAARLLAGCDPQQREAITSPARPLCVLAAAGSGKTRVLTRRIAWRVNEGSASAPYLLALTFTRKAAAELRGRLSSLGLPEPATAGTFHAIALAELRRLAAERGRPAPIVVASKGRLLASAAGSDMTHDRASLADLASEIEWAQAQCLTPRDYARTVRAARRESQFEPELVTEIWRRYEREKRRRGVLDFDDLLLGCANELSNDQEFAAAARWRFRHVFVDEYQDVNPAQVRLLEAWLGPNDDLCVVGDPDQAIYAWNGSDPRALVDFPLRHPGAQVIRLSMNYRSAEAVLVVAASVLGANGGASPPPPSGPGIGEAVDRPGQLLVSAGQRPSVTAHPVVAYDTDADEAQGVVASLRHARPPGASWSSLAVLARTNAQLALFERELDASAVPYRSGGGRAFLARPSVRQALNRLTSRSDVTQFRAWLDDLLEQAPDLGSATTGYKADYCEPSSGDSELAGTTGGDADLCELSNLALEYLGHDLSPTPEGFVTWLEASLRSDPPRQAGDAVDLVTFHRAKGLEWRVVFVTGLEEGLVPIAHARTAEAVAEERRLLYVACTRAIDDLRCSWARERSFGGRRSVRKPSPYLEAIEAAHRELASLTDFTPERSRASQQAVRALLAGRQRVRREP